VAMPTTTVELAFTTDPGDTPTWTDVSAYQREFVVHRGRVDDQSPFGPGQLQLTLTNEDRRFDPQYTSSPYWPNVVPMRRIRIRATWNAITYDVFNGYVTDWRQVYQPPQSAECVLEATDAFKVLGNIELPGSAYEAEVRADGPVMWWRLGESAGSTTVMDQIGGRVATIQGAPTLGSDGLVTKDTDTALLTTTNTDGALSDIGPAVVTGRPLTISGIVKLTGGLEGSLLLALETAGGQPVIEFSDDVASVSDTLGNSANVTAGVVIDDGDPHLVTFTWEADGTMTFYVDGVAGTPDSFTETIPAPVRIRIGTSVFAAETIDELVVYDTALSPARVAALHAARSAPWNGDLSGARVGRILDAAGWPAADRNVDTGQAVLQSADLAQTALAALQKIEQTEQGALFVTGAGLVRFVSRTSLLSAPYTTSQGTFGDSGAELEYGDLSYTYDDALIFNEIQVSRSGGTVMVVEDTTSQDRYLRRTRTLDGLLHQDDATSVDLANWILAHYKDPILRVTGMKLEPSAGNETTHFPHALGRELMDRVTVLRRPQNLGAAISQEAMIQGITHTVTAVEWVTTWDLSPAETQVYWILGVAGFSELGETTRLGF
jgi:hypothetical protein